MNRITLVLSGVLAICLLCSGMKRIEKEPSLTITPAKLRLFVNQHTDPYTIRVAYTLNIPAGFIPSCAKLIYQPYFQGEGHRFDLTPLIVSGKENLRRQKRLEEVTGQQPAYPDGMHLVSDGSGMKIKLLQTVPFEVWMAQSKLRADVILEACDRKSHIEVLTLADGVIWFPQGPGPVIVKYIKETAAVDKVATMSFLYPTGETAYQREYDGNREQMKKMMGLIDSLQTDTTMHLKKMVITGVSSPSGEIAYDNRLAQQRAWQMRQRFMEQKNIDARLIEVKYATAAWPEVKKLIQQSDMPDKNEVYRIIDGQESDTRKNYLLRQLPQYNYLQQKIFPDLQKVTCTFYYTQKEKVTKIIPE